ncbi:glycoside hydrolase family 18 protein [Sandaracinus amylolyticus]|uniref:glycoside hydrolase family 18 protein n=1 Tax=Sandaracinus amylolyticus TaxID=927083 RepID=UPI001F16C185|nr:glycoside hydrolase family 18 protein [Sandaracinus amylolyticus]UJR87042.1 Hypothetical protein I5071_91430 [Sandaracinus amylolyticus]
MRVATLVLALALACGCSTPELDAAPDGAPGRDDDGGASGADGGDDDGGTTGRSDGGPVDPDTDAGDPLPVPGARVVGYFSAWSVYQRNYHVMDMPAEQLTHINYAFLNIQNGRCVLGDSYADIERAYPGDTWEGGAVRGSFHQLELLKQAHPHLRTLLSVGGWTWSGSFSDVALSDASRRTFAESCIDIMVRYGFDGLDIDWEFPVSGGLETNTRRPEDRHNYTLLLEELRRQLVARASAQGRGEPYLLTIASGQSPEAFANLELPELGRVLDWINLMSYDYHGSWERMTGHNAPMVTAPGDPVGWGVAHAVDGLLEGGVPADRIVMGVPFYGRSWTGVTGGGSGLRQSATGAGPGTWEPGVIEWKDIAANYLPNAGFTQGWDPVGQVPYLYNSSSGVFVTYDDPRSIRIKRDFARARRLGGVMIWELNCDEASDTLTRALTE